MLFRDGLRVCLSSRSEVCSEEESSSPPGDDQCGLSAYHDGQQQRRYIHTHTLLTVAGFCSLFLKALMHVASFFDNFILVNCACMCMLPGFHAPRLVTIENCMKLTQMIVQGLQESKSPLLQLPHFEEEHLRYCISKKVTTKFVTMHTHIVLEQLKKN